MDKLKHKYNSFALICIKWIIFENNNTNSKEHLKCVLFCYKMILLEMKIKYL